MADPVRALSNHYETLQVSPRATTEEIVQAFASHMRTARMRPDITVARLARLSVAYETLRDPGKRRTYDASIGLTREATAVPPKFPSLIGAPVIARLNRIAEPSQAGGPPRPQAAFAPAVQPEPRVAAFIAASLRGPAEHAPRTEPTPPSPVEPPPPVRRAVEAPSTPVDERAEVEDGRPSIGRTAATLTAGVIGVSILAFTAALPSRNPDRLPSQGSRAEAGLTVPVPPATTAAESLVAAQPLSATAARASASPGLQAKSERAAPGGGSQSGQGSSVVDQQSPKASSDALVAQSLPSESGVQQPSTIAPPAETPAIATDSTPISAPVTAPAAAPGTAAVTTAAAALPLPGATIARTIERIGYGCGKVISSTGVEGAAGVFNITCSSGDTYRASPVRGRYHFKRMGSH